MGKVRLDQSLVQRGLTASRSQAENYIKLGYVKVNGKSVTKPGSLVSPEDKIRLAIKQQYVSRAALKLESVVGKFKLDFKGKVVLDVGSSTGGFTDFALRSGASKVVAVDVGADQMHLSLRNDSRVELHERTDIRDIRLLDEAVDIVVIDVSFISLREVLPAVMGLTGNNTQIVAMCKPQFEAGSGDMHKGVIKNDAMRRSILKDFEQWTKKSFKIIEKADSSVSGSHGNVERFYLLRKI